MVGELGVIWCTFWDTVFFGEACYILFKRLFKRLLGGVKTFICMDLEIIWTKKSEYLDEEIGVFGRRNRSIWTKKSESESFVQIIWTKEH